MKTALITHILVLIAPTVRCAPNLATILQKTLSKLQCTLGLKDTFDVQVTYV